jgi:GT2 family glycosyltransferase
MARWIDRYTLVSIASPRQDDEYNTGRRRAFLTAARVTSALTTRFQAMTTQSGSLAVAVTCFNHERFIESTLDSVLTQSRRPDEIVVVDDASSDRSPEIIAAVAARSPIPIRLERRQTNSGGPARPTNQAVGATRSDLVALLEGDDVCVPGRLEAQSRALAADPAAPLCFGLSETTGPDGNSLAQYRIGIDEILPIDHRQLAGDLYSLDARSLYVHVLDRRNVAASFSNMMVRRTSWDVVGGVHEKYRVCMDLDFLCRCCAVGNPILVAQVTCVHRLHGQNAGGASGIRNRRDLITFKADHASRPLISGALDHWAAQLPDLLMSQAYWEARDGMWLSSVGSYLRAARAGAPALKALTSAVKAAPHAAAARMGFRRTP